MKRYIKASSEYENYFTFTPLNQLNKRFGVHYTYGGHVAGGIFKAQVSEIHPYDDAEYAWAKINPNMQVIFYKDGKIVDKMQLAYYDEDDYEEVGKDHDDYINDCLRDVAEVLTDLNKDVRPIMVHN